MPKRFSNAVFRPLPQILICLALIGCAPRKPVTSTSPSFRLAFVNSGSLLLSPNIPAQQSTDAPVAFTLDGKNQPTTTSNACAATDGAFRLERESQSHNLRVVLPPPKTWIFGFNNSSGADENNTIESLYAFLRDIDRAQAAGCFASTDTHARDYILQNVPTRPSDSLFNAYGYRIERSGVSLKPNLRLKVERAYFSSSEKSDKNYLGLSDVLFDVTPNSDGSLQFQQAQALHYAPDSLAKTDHEGSRDLAILTLKPQKHYRVLFYTHQVPADQNFSAAIIGADDPARLDAFEQAMRADAGASCSSSTHDDIQCLEFRGFVTVSVQIQIELNGKPKFVDWSTTVKAVVPPKSLKSLKIQRRFGNSYYDVTFNRSDKNILDLTLVGADRLTW
jgi:hypothetical protein